MLSVKEIKSKIKILDYIESSSGLSPISYSDNTYYFTKCPICGGYKGYRNFSVNIKYKSFNCYNCGNRGDVITYHMKKYKKEFKEALNDLNLYI